MNGSTGEHDIVSHYMRNTETVTYSVLGEKMTRVLPPLVLGPCSCPCPSNTFFFFNLKVTTSLIVSRLTVALDNVSVTKNVCKCGLFGPTLQYDSLR